MRLHQISPREDTSIDEAVNIVLIPVHCTCIAIPEDGRFAEGSPKIYIGGLPIEDLKVTLLLYSGSEIKVTFKGTALIHTTGGIKDALDRLYQVPIEVWTDGVVGLGQSVALEINGTITLVTPNGRVVQLIGAMR